MPAMSERWQGRPPGNRGNRFQNEVIAEKDRDEGRKTEPWVVEETVYR